jgi:acyl-CoA dehydrogenase
MTEPLGNDSFPYFGEEHTMLRATIRRFIADRVLPNGDMWEDQGYVPREVLIEMGSLGLLGMRYAPEYGGSGLDTLANAVLAEELGRSTYGGFAVTVLVHTDMARRISITRAARINSTAGWAVSPAAERSPPWP